MEKYHWRYCWGNQGDANFLVGLQKNPISAALDCVSTVYQCKMTHVATTKSSLEELESSELFYN